MNKTLTFATSTELLRIPVDSLVYIKADGNYSAIFVTDGNEYVITLQLGQIEQRMSSVAEPGDNGEILGAFVLKGNLLSTGRSKAGFCAIIGGAITVGVADTTPFLEQALDSGGDFFRQYPLVVGSQIVENKPKGKSYRKALAELSGKMVVIMSCDKMTFHDFSQALVDLGVTNAIYLVGSTAYGFARVEDGSIVTFGEKVENSPEHVSYIVWRDERKQMSRK